jgi:hypothetical protein
MAAIMDSCGSDQTRLLQPYLSVKPWTKPPLVLLYALAEFARHPV